MTHPVIEGLVGLMAESALEHCSYEGCPGYRRGPRGGHTHIPRLRMAWHAKYLFVHAGWCAKGAQRAARERGETFGWRLGI